MIEMKCKGNSSRGAGRIAEGAVLRVILLMLFVAFGVAFAGQDAHAESNFVINDYDIDMQVNEDDTYLITETLYVHFTAPSHGIYRTIPYKISLDRDGQQSRYYGRVKDFKMLTGQPVDEEKGEEAMFYKIGDPDRYESTDTTYKYSYVFDMRGDHLKDADEVYYNLVGTSWEAQTIERIRFRITFPKDIDTTKVGIKTGLDEMIPYKAKGNREIYGETTVKPALLGLTVRVLLPEGYFTRQAATSNFLFYLLAAIIAAVTAVGAVLWRRYGRDPQIVETEEFYPPDGLNAAEVAYLDEGIITNSQVTGMLLTLADKGYVKIAEKEVLVGKKGKPKTEYTITRLKEYDGGSEDERIFMEGLFDAGAKVTMEDLEDKFYAFLNLIRDNIKERYEDFCYDKKADSIAWTLRFIACCAMVALFVISKVLNGSPFIVGHGDFLMHIVFEVLEVVLPLVGFAGIAAWVNAPGRKKAYKYIFGLIGWGVLVAAGLILAIIFDTCMGPQIPAYLISAGMIFLLLIMASLCTRKTDEYAAVLGRIRGYKNFLNVAEKERMEMLAEEDPDYFYRNLAFAFALGLTTVYAKNFASMAKEKPDWYDAPYMVTGSAFNASSMMSSMNSMMSTASTSMTSSPSSGGGGGSFSGGGGAGGGGGGSW